MVRGAKAHENAVQNIFADKGNVGLALAANGAESGDTWPGGRPMVRIGFRIPSLKKRLSARTSLKRYVRHGLGLKVPRGWGWLTNPRKAAYNRVYNRTTRGCLVVAGFWGVLALAGLAAAAVLVR